MPNSNMRNYELTPPKTKAAIRVNEVDDIINKMMKKLKIRQSEMKLARPDEIEHDNQFIFSRPNGYPFSAKMLSYRMERILKKTSIQKHATPHIFRHTHVSMLAEAGEDLKSIMDRVGHEDSKITTNVYTHISEKMKKDTSANIKNHYGSILNLSIPDGM